MRMLRCGKSRSRYSPCRRYLVDYLDAVCALKKAGFRILRQSKHVVMSDGVRIVTMPRNNLVNAYTMGGIARDAGLTVEEFRALL